MIHEIIHLLLLNVITLTVYMTLWFAVAYAKKRLDVVDTAWGGGFILVAYGCFMRNPSGYTLAAAVMVALWGLRLMLHIASRNRGKQNDPRYDALSNKWSPGYFWVRAYLSIFVTQGLLIAIISLPLVVIAAYAQQHHMVFAAVGITVWLIGLIIEATADAQLSRFIRHKTPENPVMNTGLWRYSRHPNYFGEVLVWWGIGIFALGASYGWLACVGPLVITALIIFVSGIPPLEKRKKDDPAYQAYAAKTSRFIPLPPKS